MLSRLPGARVRFIALTAGPYRTDNRQLTLIADEPLSAVPHPEIIMVPGGFGTRELMTPNPLLDWIRTAHATSQWTTSVRDRVRPPAAVQGRLAGDVAAAHRGPAARAAA